MTVEVWVKVLVSGTSSEDVGRKVVAIMDAAGYAADDESDNIPA